MKNEVYRKASEHKEEIIALRREGKTYREIAELFGVSTQRVHKIISKQCNRKDPLRKCDFDIENIVYEGIYDLFANDNKMTIAKLTRIAFGYNSVDNSQKERIRRLILNQGDVKLSLQNISNICEYTGQPFERVFKVRI